MVGEQFLRICENSDYYPPFSERKVCQHQGEAGVLTEALSTYLTPALPSDDGTKFWHSENFSAGVAIVPWAQHLQSSCLPRRWLIDISTLCSVHLIDSTTSCLTALSSAHFPQSHSTHPLLVRCPQLIWLWNFHLLCRMSYYCFSTALSTPFFFPTTSVHRTHRVVWISGRYPKFLYL